MNDVKDFLQELKTLNNNQSVKIFVPSQKRELEFKPLSAKQQKDIIKTVLSGIEGNIALTQILNDIIYENSIEKAVKFMLYDRNKILIELRKFSIGNSVKLSNKDYNLHDLPDNVFIFNETLKFSHNNIEIECDIPSLELDSDITLKSIHEFYKFDSEEQKLINSVNILLVYELIKFISVVKINEHKVAFNEISLSDRKDIVDTLPLAINNKVLEYIARYKQHEQDCITFNDNVYLTIDASFLSSE